MKVEFIQFLRPNGLQVPIEIELDGDLKPTIDLILANDMRLTAEELMTGKVSFAAEHELGDYLLIVCENGPGVPHAVAGMIRSFSEPDFNVWLASMKGDLAESDRAAAAELGVEEEKA